jgi:hypothetical protein
MTNNSETSTSPAFRTCDGSSQSERRIGYPGSDGTCYLNDLLSLARRSFLIPLTVTFAFIPPALARTWVILDDGSGDMPTIQGGIVRAANGDTVLVMPGTYHEDIDFLGKGVVLKSDSGPEVTILNGANEDSSIIIFKRSESSQAVLDGFTLTEGTGTPFGGGRDGGAVFCRASSPMIRNNIIVSNEAEWGGGIVIGEAGAPPGPIGSPQTVL